MRGPDGNTGIFDGMPDEPEDRPEDFDRPPPFFPLDDEAERESQDFGEPVEVRVEGVFTGAADGKIQQFVLLTDGRRRLPILIGPFEAQAIVYPLDGVQPDRPMTHDLLRAMVERLGGRLDRVVIDDLWNTTYYAKLYIRRGPEEMEVDSRPSDAIALAVRFEAPIFVSERILEQAGVE